MAVRGWATGAKWVDQGSELVEDALTGSTTLAVDWVGDFDDEGGTLRLDGVDLDYVSVDEDANTIELEDPLEADFTAGISAQVTSGDEVLKDYILFVNHGEGDEAEIEIPFEQRDVWPEGDYDPWVEVTLSDDLEQLESVPGIMPRRDLSFADPTTIPEPVAVEPPETSPALTVYGMPNGFVVSAEQVAPTTLIQYYIGTEDGFAFDESTAFGPPTRDTVIVPTQLPDGSPFDPDRDYYFSAIAFNTEGSAPASGIVSARVDLSVVATFVASTVVAVAMVTQALNASTVTIGAATISAEDGIQVPGVVSIPFDGVTPMDFLGFARLLGATVQDNLNVYGLARLFGDFVAANGIPDPRVKSTASRDWERIRLTDFVGDTAGTSLMHGMSFDAGDVWTGSYYNGPVIQTFDGDTGGILVSLGCTGSHVTPAFAVDGYTRLDGVNYFLGRDTARGDRRFLYAFDDLGAKLSEWEYTSDSTSPYQPTLGNDGTNLVIARCIATGEVRFRRYDPADMSTVGSVVTTGHSPARDLTGVYWGSADFGGTRLVVSIPSAFYVYNTSGTRQTGDEWGRASSTPARVFGWDGTRFAHIDDSGRLWLYQDDHPTTSDVDHCYAWIDDDTDGGASPEHTTAHSPTVTFTWPARSRLTVKGQAAPDAGVTDPSLHDLANKTAIYVGPSGGTMRLQAVLDPGETEWTQAGPLDTGSDAAPTDNDFGDTLAPGSFQSDATDDDGEALAYLRGDGSFRALKAKQTETVVLGPFGDTGAANEETATITFAVPFDASPSVIAWAHGDPTNFICWASGVSATGFTLHAYRVAGLGSFTVSWTAEARTG